LVDDEASAKFIARREFLANATLCPDAAKHLLRKLWRDGNENRMPWSHDGDALEQKVMEKIVVHMEGVTARLPSLLSEAEEGVLVVDGQIVCYVIVGDVKVVSDSCNVPAQEHSEGDIVPQAKTDDLIVPPLC
jgi:hypothetical protein